MRSGRNWLTAFITFFLIAVPGIVALFFVISEADNLPFFWMAIIALGFLVYTGALAAILIALRLLLIDALAFFIPLGIVFALLFLARDMPWWGAVLMALLGIVSALPANMLVSRLKRLKHRPKKAPKV